MSIYFIGGFPPPYGGVTVKNINLYSALSGRVNIKKIDFNKIKRKSISEAVRLTKALLTRSNQFIVGVAGKHTRKRLCKLMYFVNKKAMMNSVIFLMGGTVANDIAEDGEYQKYIACFKRVYAETKSMCDTLRRVKLNNVEYYPNCRFKPNEDIVKKNIPKVEKKAFKLHTVFFSRICKEKGIEIIIETARNLPEVAFHLYGEIANDCRGMINEALSKQENVFYHGVFFGSESELYSELSMYDVVLLPTKWKAEGVPGVLVEAKIAGVPAIVSDICFNAEIVNNGVDGVVLKKNDSNNLEAAIKKLFDLDYLHLLSDGAVGSAYNYYLENYLDSIVQVFE